MRRDMAAARERAAAPERAAARDAAATFDATVTLRFATFDDTPDLLRLAQLDSAVPLSEPILAGEVSGRTVAALSLADGRAIADPFVRSAGVVELLRARARQLEGSDCRRWWQRARRTRGGIRGPRPRVLSSG